MKRNLLILIAAIFCGGLNAFGALTADWRLHMPFDRWATKVIETPNRVYFIGRTYEFKETIQPRSTQSFSLFYYDKEGDEIISLNKLNDLSDNVVSQIAYNFDKKYLVVVYSNCNIDILYDNGRVENIPALKVTSIPGKKEVNSISFDNANNRIYLGTTFGYVSINDVKHEIAESRNYDEPVKAIIRTGDHIVMAIDDKIYVADASSQRFNLDDFTEIEKDVPTLNTLMPLKNGDFLALNKDKPGSLYRGSITSSNGVEWEKVLLDGTDVYDDPRFIDVHNAPNGGYSIVGNVRYFQVSENGEIKATARPREAWTIPASSLDGNTLWSLKEKSGIRCYKKNGNDWDVVKDYMRPNAPATYISTAMAYHPTYGLLVGSNGVDLALTNFNQMTEGQVSALKNSFWQEYSPAYRADGVMTNGRNYYGVAIDPQNPDYVYRGSALNGIQRINLKDPNDLIVMANPSNYNSNIPEFVKIVDDLEVWDVLCRFTTPGFDNKGIMWSLYNDADNSLGRLYYWTPADRQNIKGGTAMSPKYIELPSRFISSNYDSFTVLTSPRNANMFAIGGFSDGGAVILYDTNGTPEVTSDDRFAYIWTPYDQDGGRVNFQSVNQIYEDQETGLLWIMSQRGVFTVNPQTAFDNPEQINRIKVSRNDGTQLADYLLNEVNVNHIATDGEGRKWISTSNGIVCTSRDGRSILAEFTSDNSYLPDDNVYVSCYNPENNSMMIGTDSGLVEMFPSGSGNTTGTTGAEARIYPNPVEPDYYGWVSIDNIEDGSIVKITDAQGGLVKELGPAESGKVEWDVTGMNHNRVSTGVYYVMVSPGNGKTGKSAIYKILVLN